MDKPYKNLTLQQKIFQYSVVNGPVHYFKGKEKNLPCPLGGSVRSRMLAWMCFCVFCGEFKLICTFKMMPNCLLVETQQNQKKREMLLWKRLCALTLKGEAQHCMTEKALSFHVEVWASFSVWPRDPGTLQTPWTYANRSILSALLKCEPSNSNFLFRYTECWK